MHLTILGSGTNVHPARAAAGYLVRTDRTFLLDFGPRTLANLMKTGADRHRITHILFSHFHADHFSDFIPFFFDAVYFSRFVGKRPDVTLIGPRGTRRLFRAILDTFPGFKAARFGVRIKEVADRSFMLGRTRIRPRTVLHSPRLHCVGYRIEHQGKALAYSGDAQYCAGLVRLCHGADVAVLDCSFPANPARPRTHACRGLRQGGAGGRRQAPDPVALLPHCRAVRREDTGGPLVQRPDYSGAGLAEDRCIAERRRILRDSC